MHVARSRLCNVTRVLHRRCFLSRGYESGVIKEPEAWGSCALAGGTHGPLYCAVLPLALAATVQLRAVASFILMCHQTIEFWEQWY